MSKKLDRLSTKFDDSGAGNNKCDREVEMYRMLVHQLQRENQDLKEILDMEKILSTNTEKELEQLNIDLRERNDIINNLQIQNDTLREENKLYEARPMARRNIPVDVLLDL